MLKCGKGEYEGFLEGREDCYYFHLYLPNFPQFNDAVMKTSWNLKLLFDRSTNADNWAQSFNTLRDFYNALKKIVGYQSVRQRVRSQWFYHALHEELDAIGPSASVRQDLSAVDIMVTDSGGRLHSAVVLLPLLYPEEQVQVVQHELPIENTSSLDIHPNFTNVRTLLQFYEEFSRLIEIFQQFWEAMESLNANCWVTEPQNPVHSDIFRRVQISTSCSVLLTFNPYSPLKRPVIEFRGAEDEVEMFRTTLGKNLLDNRWDSEVDVHLNLLLVLDLDSLPAKETTLNSSLALVKPGECGICFEDRLDGHTANQRCENPRCSSQYHQVCLLKYLCATRSNVRMKNAILGRCPTCRDTIGCTILSWANFK